jgi:hypothetical protein
MRILIVLFILLAGIFAKAETYGQDAVVGTIKALDNKTIRVENDKFIYEVPANFVAEKNLKPGQHIEIPLSTEKIDQVKITKKKTPKK